MLAIVAVPCAAVPCTMGLVAHHGSNANLSHSQRARETAKTVAAESVSPLPPPVLLLGLAKELCNQQVMEAVLEQAGLGSAMLKCELFQRSHAGEARLIFRDWLTAKQCIAHFSGRKWGTSCISAMFDSQHEEGTTGKNQLVCMSAERSHAEGQVLNYCGVRVPASSSAEVSTASTASGSGRQVAKLDLAALDSDVQSNDDEDVLYPTPSVQSCRSVGSRELDHRAETLRFPATDEQGLLRILDRTRDPPPVVLTGLPLELCSHDWMQVTLELAGLENSYLKCEMKKGFCQGEARITFKSWEMAEQCIAHFSRCKWKGSYMDVLAYFDGSMLGASNP